MEPNPNEHINKTSLHLRLREYCEGERGGRKIVRYPEDEEICYEIVFPGNIRGNAHKVS